MIFPLTNPRVVYNYPGPTICGTKEISTQISNQIMARESIRFITIAFLDLLEGNTELTNRYKHSQHCTF